MCVCVRLCTGIRYRGCKPVVCRLAAFLFLARSVSDGVLCVGRELACATMAPKPQTKVSPKLVAGGKKVKGKGVPKQATIDLKKSNLSLALAKVQKQETEKEQSERQGKMLQRIMDALLKSPEKIERVLPLVEGDFLLVNQEDRASGLVECGACVSVGVVGGLVSQRAHGHWA